MSAKRAKNLLLILKDTRRQILTPASTPKNQPAPAASPQEQRRPKKTAVVEVATLVTA